MNQPKRFVHQIALLCVGISAFCFYRDRIYLTLVFVSLGLSLVVSIAISPKSAPHIVSTWNKAISIISKVTNPIILGILYICLVTPFAIYWRITGKSRIHLENRNKSTWSDYSRVMSFKSLEDPY
jgi:hypothetical protein